MDLYTLGFITMALIGLVTSEAVLSANTLSVAISVPPAVEEIGFTGQTAEEIFAAEVKRIVDAPSTISRPSMRISSRKSVVGVVSDSLQLGGLTSAIQDAFGQETLRVTGALLKENEAYRLVLTVSDRDSIPIHLEIRRADNDVVAVLRDGATATFERVAPYRVALSRFLAGIKGDETQLARSRVDTKNALKTPAPSGRESEWAGLHTLDALHYLMDNSPKEADAAFRRAYGDPNISAGAKAIGEVNYTFMAINRRQPEAALNHARAAREQLAAAASPPWNLAAYIDLNEGLAAWAAGDTASAERLIARAEGKMPKDETPLVYLVQLLTSLSRTEAADAARSRLERSSAFSGEIPAMAISLFWIDPRTGAIERRNR